MLRRLREDDAGDVVRLYREAFGDERRLDAQTGAGWFRNPELNPDWLRVLEADGLVVGYGDVVVGQEEVEVDLAAPGRWDAFLDWAEDTARSAGISRVRAVAPAGHELGVALSRRGAIAGGGPRTRWRSPSARRRPVFGRCRTGSRCERSCRATPSHCAPR